MDVIYSLLPAMILLALVSVIIFFWAARTGQYDDMEGPANRIIDDDDDPMLPGNMRNGEGRSDQKRNEESKS